MSTAFELPTWPIPDQLALAGVYRASPEDFRVVERLVLADEQDGEHVYCDVTKRGLNSADVAAGLAQRFSVPLTDVGYCGAKDRHAVTRQWFSVRVPGTDDPAALLGGADDAPATMGAGPEDGCWRVERCLRQRRKLRRGQHFANEFVLRVRLATASQPALDAVRERLEAGVPNYFGPQRFGRGGANLARGARWVEGSLRLPRRGTERGFLLSAARSLLFNEVLAARVREGTLDRVLDGDVVDEQGAATGPLWGRGRSPAAADAALVEARALAPWRSWCDALELVGLSQERRPLVLRCDGLAVRAPGDDSLELTFSLPPGAFATSVLAALGPLVDARVVHA